MIVRLVVVVVVVDQIQIWKLCPLFGKESLEKKSLFSHAHSSLQHSTTSAWILIELRYPISGLQARHIDGNNDHQHIFADTGVLKSTLKSQAFAIQLLNEFRAGQGRVLSVNSRAGAGNTTVLVEWDRPVGIVYIEDRNNRLAWQGENSNRFVINFSPRGSHIYPVNDGFRL